MPYSPTLPRRCLPAPLAAQLAVTAALTGLIWFVHIVHYPLFSRIPADSFVYWHAEHVRLTGLIVIGPMLLELALAIAMVFRPPAGVPRRQALLGLSLLAVVWAATFFGAVPAHARLSQSFTTAAHQDLMAADLLRAMAWSARTAWLLLLILKRSPPPDQ